MSTVVIPTDTTLYYWDQTTTLDGVPYLLGFRYNAREACYYLNIRSSDGSITYAQGIKVVANYPLLRNYPTPPGELYAASTGSDDSPPALGELGPNSRVVLAYVEAADLYANGDDSWRNPNI